jgi:L-methionine (R)-S-oxide reductase
MNKEILDSIKAELNGAGSSLAKLLNTFAMLREELGEGSWVGLYVYNEKLNSLVLGPFQGSPACEEIKPGRGVVGSCYAAKRAIYVKDVSTFPGYISCDAKVKSEAVWPLMYDEQVIAVFDIDSDQLDGLKNDLPILDQIAFFLSQVGPNA